MPISWNEIKARAYRFVNEWKDTRREEADAQSFLIDLLDVFGISRKRVATFEHKVKKLDASSGYIDLLWPGMMLVEMKSRGQDMDKAYRQAKDYCHGLQEHELPRFMLICDFHTFHFYDEENTKHVFTLADLLKNLPLFSVIAGYTKSDFQEQNPVNIKAAELMGKVHDELKANGYEGHQLELYLVRLLFILFADDTNIFERGIFLQYVLERTADDGTDLAMHMAQIFEVLNTPEDRRMKNLDEQLRRFPYVNGKLFDERLPLAAFDSAMRNEIIRCCSLDWSAISPAIFGSLFQSVMDEKSRRNLGAHYTSERNILKVIRPLFMDELVQEFITAGDNKTKLQRLHDKISRLRFLDPACGCGNFLVTAYRELRFLELEIVRKLLGGQTVTNIAHYFLVDVDQFYGIEYEEFPAQIAQVAMWLIDHQMNMLASETFGEYMPRIPLRKSAVIVHGNALHTDWQSLIVRLNHEKEPPRFHYIMGNPPFIGSKFMTTEQRADILSLFSGISGAGVLDYVTGWYKLAAQYAKTHDTKVAFVSTNSIAQGEQVGLLWRVLMDTYKMYIHFAHQTFKWSNEARGVAGVYCVVVGFGQQDPPTKRLFVYQDVKTEPVEIAASHINPYLVEGKDVFIQSRSKPLCDVPEIGIGNKPIDGGHYLFTTAEKNEFVTKDPSAAKWFRRWLGSDEFINGYERWCLWLGECPPNELRHMPEVLKRVEAVRKYRSESVSAPTRKLADTPTRFHVENMPKSNYLIIPEVSSERRRYIPIGYEQPETLSSNLVKIVPNAKLYHFGVLTSEMHMTWVRYVCGRLESRYRYSKDIVYNNFPWPEAPSEKQVKIVESAAQTVLDTREKYKGSSLADLYDPNTMPPDLVAAHHKLDKAVDLCYRSSAFTNDTKRIEFLFELYNSYTAELFSEGKKKRKVK